MLDQASPAQLEPMPRPRFPDCRAVLRQGLHSADNYRLVLALIVLAMLVTAVADSTPAARVVALVLLADALLFAIHTSRTAPGLEGLAALLVTAAVGLGVASVVVTGLMGIATRFDTAGRGRR